MGIEKILRMYLLQCWCNLSDKERDPEMHQTKKGNQYYFGMKCHAGVDAGSGYVHSLETTAANVHDITVAPGLIREDDAVFYIVKRFFDYCKTVYRGLTKNTHRLHVLFASANLLMCIRAGRPLRPARG